LNFRLKEKFRIPFPYSPSEESKETEKILNGIRSNKIPPEIQKVGRRRISADTALRLSKYFGNSAKFWLGLQDDYDLEEELNSRKPEFQKIKRRKDYAA